MMEKVGRTGWTYVVLAVLLGGALTMLATWAGAAGVGADDTWAQGVSLRTGSAAGGGRVIVGGGVSGGK